MKSENPTISLGALQQKTMTRIVELKAQKKAKERKLREEFLRQEEEERIRNQTLAKKYVDKWVEKLKPHHQEPQRERPRGEPLHPARHAPSAQLEGRRLSVESGQTHGTTNTGSSNDELVMQIHPFQMATGSHEDNQGFNIAPRRSVGNLKEHERQLRGTSSLASVEGGSKRSGGSDLLLDASGVFVDGDSVATPSTARSRSTGMSRGSGLTGVAVDGYDNDENDSGDDGDLSDIAVSGDEDSDGNNDEDESDDRDLSRNSLRGWECKLQKMLASRPELSFNEDDFVRLAVSDLNGDEEEDGSSSWEVRSDGLIVGFVDRSTLAHDRKDEDEDELIVGFSDRSDAFDCSRHSSPGEADEAAGLGNIDQGGQREGGPPQAFIAKPTPYAPEVEEPKACRGWFRQKNSLPDTRLDTSSSAY